MTYIIMVKLEFNAQCPLFTQVVSDFRSELERSSISVIITPQTYGTSHVNVLSFDR